MNKLILLIFSLFLSSCSQNNSWSSKEKKNYMVSCITNYDKAKPNSLQEARCYCIEALNLTIELYPNAKEADSKITVSEINLIIKKANKKLKEVNNLGTCL